jgi:methylated-DNA-[protein]-cysteine S-methyltransferase
MKTVSVRAPVSAVLALPVGCVAVYSDADAIEYLEFQPPGSALMTPVSAPARQFSEQLSAYLAAAGNAFALPLADDVGSAHQRRVWQRLRTIPVGERISYSHLASDVGSGARAVANACRANWFPLVVPCHRVVAKSGLGGFSGQRDGWQLELKQWLLRHEQQSR